MKKVFLLLVAVFMLATSNVTLASDLYEIQESPDSYYYNDGAVRGGYIQGMAPINTYVQGANVEYGDLKISADVVALQVLPMAQVMGGQGNGGFMSSSTNWNKNCTFYIDAAFASGGDYSQAYVYPIHGYYWSPNQAYAYDYNYYENDGGQAIAGALSVYLSKSEYFNTNFQTTIPAEMTLVANQRGANETILTTPNLKLEMRQMGEQTGFLKINGHGQQIRFAN